MGENEDKDEASPKYKHMEDDEKDDENDMWVSMRMKIRLSLRITT